MLVYVLRPKRSGRNGWLFAKLLSLELKKIMTLMHYNDCKWFVLFTMPNHEKMVCQNLMKRGIEAFLPLRKEIRQWSDRKKRIMVPLFPNYVFIKIPANDRFKVFEVPGIVRYLDSNANPTVIREREIDIIKSFLNEDFEVTNEQFAKGDEVLITSGPMRNIRGVLVCKRGTKRLLISIESIKRNLLIDVSPYNLERMSPHKFIPQEVEMYAATSA